MLKPFNQDNPYFRKPRDPSRVQPSMHVCSPTEITVEELIRQLKEAGCKNPDKAVITSDSDLVCHWDDE